MSTAIKLIKYFIRYAKIICIFIWIHTFILCIQLKASPKAYIRYNIFALFLAKKNTNRLLVQLILCSVLSKWIHDKIRLLLTILTCLRRLSWGDYLFINTHTFSLSAIQTHTQKQTCNERALYQAHSPSFIKRQKIALCRDCQCRLPSQSPFVSHASTK